MSQGPLKTRFTFGYLKTLLSARLSTESPDMSPLLLFLFTLPFNKTRMDTLSNKQSWKEKETAKSSPSYTSLELPKIYFEIIKF